MRKPVKKALFSVDDFEGVLDFVASLKELGWRIIATSETVEKLKGCDIVVEDVTSFTGVSDSFGFPPTLHPKIEAALTLDASDKIDLVYDVPYPLSKGNDVGGLTLLALAAKGGRIVCFTPEDLKDVIEELKQDKNHASISGDFRQKLIDKANTHITGHFLELARRNGESLYDGVTGESSLRLACGENPYQVPADLFTSKSEDILSLARFSPVNDSVPCFTNLADLDSILFTLCLASDAFKRRYKKIPFISIAAKHGNACGMAVDWDSTEKSVLGALFGNPLAVWGGEFICNFKITEDLAKLLIESRERKSEYGNKHWMLDVIAAPGFANEAVDVLGKRAERRLLKNPALSEPSLPESGFFFRHVRGGFLRQPLPDFVLDLKSEKLGSRLVDSLIVAWSVAYSSFHGGNEVALAGDGKLIGVGGGPSTVDAAETAVRRAKARGHDTRDSVFVADAFFPFTDAPKILVEAGCSAGVVPSGGKNEKEVMKFFQENNIDMVYLPSEYRGFCRH